MKTHKALGENGKFLQIIRKDFLPAGVFIDEVPGEWDVKCPRDGLIGGNFFPNEGK
jgi:hypothetical protein